MADTLYSPCQYERYFGELPEDFDPKELKRCRDYDDEQKLKRKKDRKSVKPTTGSDADWYPNPNLSFVYRMSC